MNDRTALLNGVLQGVRAVLLDFDGPITALMPPPANAQAADLARRPLLEAGLTLPFDIAESRDHIAVLRFAATASPSQSRAVEIACDTAEVVAATESEVTEGAAALLIACHRHQVPVVVVSNNTAAAVEAFLDKHDLRRYVDHVLGRPRARPDLLKPHPHLIDQALALVAMEGAAGCVLIGDSTTDVDAGHTRGVPVIGYAKNSRRGDDLRAAGADAVTTSMLLLADLLPN